MKRRQEGTKILVIGIAGMLLAIGTGCGAGRGEPFPGKDPKMESREVSGGEQDALLDWQSQYDLGIRLLGEGKYQEAIIAFTAAIEIEPSRAALYAARGDAYMAMGAEGLGTAGADGLGMAGGAGGDGSETDRTGTGDPKLPCSYAAQDYAQAAILLWERYQGEGGWTAAGADGTGNLEQTEGMLPEGMCYGDLLEKALEAHEKLARAYAAAGDLQKAVDTMNAICGILGSQVMVVEEDAGQDGQGEGRHPGIRYLHGTLGSPAEPCWGTAAAVPEPVAGREQAPGGTDRAAAGMDGAALCLYGSGGLQRCRTLCL